MVDPGVAQAVVKLLNRWYRKRAKPHGSVDHFHRGTRMSYTTVYRCVNIGMALFILGISAGVFLVPGVTDGHSGLMVMVLKLGGIGMGGLAMYLLMQTIREYAVVNDEGLVKFDLLGRETRMGWEEMKQFDMKPDDNKVVFRNEKKKLTLSLAYDGWQDFMGLAVKHWEQGMFLQLNYMLANVNAKKASKSFRQKK